MPSDTPQDDRCAAKVVRKTGLEVHDSVLEQVFVDPNVREQDSPTESDVSGPDEEYDDVMETLVLFDGDHENEIDPEWEESMRLLRRDWFVEAVIVKRETDDAIDYECITIEDDDPYVTNRGTVFKGYCLSYPMDNGRCYQHGGASTGSEFGRMKTGLYTNRSKFLDWVEKEKSPKDREFVEMMVDSWLDEAPFGRESKAKVNELYRCAADQLRLWYANDEYVTKGDGPHNEEGEYSGLSYTRIVGTNDDGEEIEVFDESPLNLAYSRLDRDVTTKLTKMGVYDSPEKEQAEATQSLAQALSESE